MKRRAPLWAIILLVVLGLALVLSPAIVYVVDQRELAVVLQFGQPVAERTEPGVYFKMPLVQEVVKLPSTLQFWGDRQGDRLSDLPTKDDKKIELIPWAVWRIREPTVFVQRLRTMDNAEQRVSQFVRGAIRDVVTQYDLAELVRSTSRPLQTSATSVNYGGQPGEEPVPAATREIKKTIEYGRPKLLETIKQEAQRRLTTSSTVGEGNRGIELVDLGISQIEFVESVRIKTFDRWIAERQAISAANINEGEKLKQEIINRAAAEVERIEGEGQQLANETRGEVDAEVITKYAEAIEEAGEFYTFVRTLEAYKNSIGQDTRLILTTDSEFLELLKRLEPAGTQAPVSTGRPAGQ